MGKPQSAEEQPPKPGAAVTGLPNGVLKHEPAPEAMELDGQLAPADNDVEKKAPPKWRWRLLSFTLLPGAASAALLYFAVCQHGCRSPTESRYFGSMVVVGMQ